MNTYIIKVYAKTLGLNGAPEMDSEISFPEFKVKKKNVYPINCLSKHNYINV
jgi:hypothetical protein